MLAEERRFRIREMLSRQRTITASDLCAALGVTAVTVRRDLAALGGGWRTGPLPWGSGFPHVQHKLPTFLRNFVA